MFRTPYANPPARVPSPSGQRSRTKQEHRDECDINRIMAKFLRGGALPTNVSTGSYGDFSSVEDFQQAQEILKFAEAQFASLPSRVRDRFGNTAQGMLAFVADPKNAGEAYELGLLSEEASAKEAARRAAASAPNPPSVPTPVAVATPAANAHAAPPVAAPKGAT